MIRLINSVLGIVAVLALVTFSSCDSPPPEPAETEAEKNTKILVTGGAWNLQSVTVNGVDQTPLYEGLKVTFSSSGYTAVAGGVIWPATGTWSFTSDAGTTIHRNDGLDLAITELTQSKLVVSFNWTKTTLGSGRTKSMAGAHVVSLTR
jgi:hypothetical protein